MFQISQKIIDSSKVASNVWWLEDIAFVNVRRKLNTDFIMNKDIIRQKIHRHELCQWSYPISLSQIRHNTICIKQWLSNNFAGLLLLPEVHLLEFGRWIHWELAGCVCVFVCIALQYRHNEVLASVGSIMRLCSCWLAFYLCALDIYNVHFST